GGNFAFGVPSRKASMPPLCSTVRIARVESRSRTAWPRISDSSDVSCRLGRKRRRVLLLAWLTLLPDNTPLPVISQRRDIALGPSVQIGRRGLWRQRLPASRNAVRGSPSVSSDPLRGHRGPIPAMLAVRERRPENRQSQPSHCLKAV